MKINSAVAAAFAHTHQSPAKMARDLLASRPDLEDKAFGQIVSKLARGEDLPPAPQPSEPTEAAPETATVQSGEGIDVLT
jgi:hypothetical protein